MKKHKIDQSIKIEQTSCDTVIALSNHIAYTVIIPAKAKRQIKQRFREQGRPHLFYYRTFAAGVAFAIKDYLEEIDVIIIDTEYPGREKLIEDMILEMLQKMGCKKQPRIYFERIGKESNAHNLAYLTMKKKRKADKVLTLEELEKIIFKQNKSPSVYARRSDYRR